MHPTQGRGSGKGRGLPGVCEAGEEPGEDGSGEVRGFLREGGWTQMLRSSLRPGSDRWIGQQGACG